MGNATSKYAPFASVIAVRLNPVSTCVAVTVAPEITPPLGSAIIPRTLAVVSCVMEGIALQKIIAAADTHLVTLKNAFIHSPFGRSRQTPSLAETPRASTERLCGAIRLASTGIFVKVARVCGCDERHSIIEK